MKTLNSDKTKAHSVKIVKRLDKYKDKVLFPKKVEEANRVLREVGLPKQSIS